MYIIRRDQSHGLAAILCASRTAYTMHVVFRRMGYIIIDHQRDVRHVYSTRYHIRRHQHIDLSVSEIQHHLVAFALLEVAVHSARVYL